MKRDNSLEMCFLKLLHNSRQFPRDAGDEVSRKGGSYGDASSFKRNINKCSWKWNLNRNENKLQR